MKVTTVRFGDDLWALLADEAGRAGVSVSQYVREAALARAAFAAGARGELPDELFRTWARNALAADAGPQEKRAAADGLVAALGRSKPVRDAAALKSQSAEKAEETAALLAQSKQTARHSAQIRRRSGRRNDSDG